MKAKNAGYKFVLIDGRVDDGTNTGGFKLHIGSTMCEMPEGSEEVSGCMNPNRAEIARLELRGSLTPARMLSSFLPRFSAGAKRATFFDHRRLEA